MSRFFVLAVLCLSLKLLYSQSKLDNIWVNGYEKNFGGIGHHGHIYNFGSRNELLSYVNIPYGFSRCNTSISDHSSNLLFYTNGRGVINKNHQLMPNGAEINIGEWASRFWPNPESGYPGHEDIIILQDPGINNGYFILHKTPVYYPIGRDSIEIRMSYVDMTLDNGLGDMVYKNRIFYKTQDLLASYLTAIRHKNTKDWWVIQPLVEKSEFLTFLITQDSIIKLKNQNTYQFFDDYRSSSSGTAKFSPDGTKYALYNYYDQLHLYDFDRETGQLTNHKEVYVIPKDQIDREQYIFGSVEWSPNSRFIYTATDLYLHQIDTWKSDSTEAIRLIDTYNGTLDPFNTSFFLMAQAPDCKIYMSPANGSYSIHVINKPDELGKACDFVQNGIKLPNANGGSLPNFPRFRVDEVDKCDPSISSIFGETVYYRRDLHVYPNPSSGIYYIIPPEYLHKATLVVTDINGTIHLKIAVGQGQWPDQLDISHLPAGRYNVEIYPEDNTERIFYGRQVVKI